METTPRHSGIEIVGDVPWGTHFCQFYDADQDLIEILVPYFQEGLRANEFCMWVTSEPLQVGQAKAALQVAVPDLDRYIEKGQIEILDYSQWYTRSGKFSAEEVLQGWVNKLNSALERGYEGLRLTGNTFWLVQSDWIDFTKYEEAVNNVIRQYRMLAICTYSLRKCSAIEILDVLSNHQFALVKRSGKWETVESAHHKKIEQALRESEKRYRELVDAAPDAIIVHRGGDILFANSAALKLYGATDFEQLATNNVLRLVPHDNIRMAVDRWKMVMDGRNVPLREAKIFRLDGREVPVEVGLAPIEYDGGRAIQAIIRDISDRKRQEEHIAKVSHLYSILSHVNESIVRTHDENVLCSEVCRIVSEEGSFPLVWIGEKKGFDVIPVVSHGPSKDYLNEIKIELEGELSRGPTGTSILEDRTVINDDFETNPATLSWREQALKYGFRASAAIPLHRHSKVFGALTLYSPELKAFDPEQIELLESLGSDISYALDAIDQEKSRFMAEQSLRETSDYLENLINHANAPIIVWDSSFRITRFNNAFEKLTDLKADEVLGKYLEILFPESSKQDSMSLIQSTLAGERWESVEIPILRKDGSVRIALWNSANIFTADGTEIVATIAQGQDITERKQAEEALRDREKRLAADLYAMTYLQDISTSFVHEGDLNLLLDSILEAAIAIVGAGKGTLQLIRPESDSLEIVAQRGFDQSYIDYFSSVTHGSDAVCATAFHQGKRVIVDDVANSLIFIGTPALEIQLAAGVRSVQSTPLVDRRGKIIGMLSTHWSEPQHLDGHDLRYIDLLARQAADIIEHKQVEEDLHKTRDQLELRVQERTSELLVAQEELTSINEELKTSIEEHIKLEDDFLKARDKAEEATRAKSAFMANMSHEIRTPMNSVIGMTSLLLDEDLTTDQRDYVETIRTGGEALLTIINDILDFSKLEQEKTELEHQPFILNSTIEEAIDLVAVRVAEKKLNLAYTVDKAVPNSIKGDPTRLRQILAILLDNAVKFTEKGAVLLSVSSDRFGSQYELRFDVKDTGIGIDPANMDKLFESFSQPDDAVATKYGGTGLGLAIAKKLVEMMGGTIWAESVLGKGSTFHFSIFTDAVSSKSTEMIDPKLKDKRILIVEDNKTNRRIMGRYAKDWGMMPTTAGTSREALKLLRGEDTFDVAIIEKDLPDKDGLALAREIRQHNKTMPLIMLTFLGQGIESDSFASTLTKPLKPDQIRKTLIDTLSPPLVLPTISAPEVGQASGTMRILLAEDNPSSQKVTLEMLKKLGYRADVVANGNEVLDALARQRYDLILMDVRMPEMSGLEATRIIRQRWPDKGPIIIAITAYGLEGDRERCLEAGMNDYVSKPVQLRDLEEMLRKYAPTHGKKIPPKGRKKRH